MLRYIIKVFVRLWFYNGYENDPTKFKIFLPEGKNCEEGVDVRKNVNEVKLTGLLIDVENSQGRRVEGNY